ncbi:MarR family winged helix-turn-helix transcriptional regulator [Schaalia sp. 19OD2882]|uniref:MarR family winged helix-turn-helix transcriptional regulator n=1 Tax=Schaalia sp. 19OD2882 TaxID=2794089 RepID=UPI0020A723E2|nr:MarR family transcriptional regulator [Schaalia sp. 19OD2882]
MERAWNTYLVEQGISTAQFATMAALAEGERTQTQVAAATAVDPRNMGPTIRKLIEAGWVQTRLNPNDARSRLLSLSVAGRAWWDEAQPRLRRGREQFFRALTSDELATLEALLGKLEAAHSHESTSASN